MTGYGWGECSRNGLKVTVELSSVNRKQSEVFVNLPRELEVLEAQIRDELNQRIARGRVTARVSLHAAEGRDSARMHLNQKLAKSYATEFTRLAKELKLAGPVSLDMVLRAPGVLQASEEMADAEDFWPMIRKALQQAIDMLVAMRVREGSHLFKDLRTRIAAMRQAVAKIQKLAPKVQISYRDQLLTRIRSAGLDKLELDDDRVLKEVIFFADRSDVSEELIRLQSHFHQFDACVQSGDSIGRALDFLAQEMNREINTIGSKANDSAIAHHVVAFKADLERFREQAQNVE
ncbi:MAG: YicC family protein [Verrucomicrobia bacterium]|nr:YicC family protein [Verrucomicrobiota bacterium]